MVGSVNYSYRFDDSSHSPTSGTGGDFKRAADFLETDFIPNRRPLFRTAIEGLTTITPEP